MFNGGLGGLGGRSSSFPQRFGAPQSERVGSLHEIENSIWAPYHAAVAQSQDATDNFWTNHTDTLADRFKDYNMTPTQLAQVMEGYKSVARGPGTAGAEFIFGHAPGVAGSLISAQALPDMAPYREKAEAARAQYNETQTRNQQAYDSMRNNGQINALIGPDYSDANFGSVSGQGATQLPQIDGVNMDWVQGVYDPSQASGLFGNTGKATTRQGWL